MWVKGAVVLHFFPIKKEVIFKVCLLFTVQHTLLTLDCHPWRERQLVCIKFSHKISITLYFLSHQSIIHQYHKTIVENCWISCLIPGSVLSPHTGFSFFFHSTFNLIYLEFHVALKVILNPV